VISTTLASRRTAKFFLPDVSADAARASSLADFFNPLVNNIERMLAENAAPYPVERTLLTSGMTLFAIESLYRKQPLETPELKVAYQAPRESTYWRT
jgi:hypothetical protein